MQDLSCLMGGAALQRCIKAPFEPRLQPLRCTLSRNLHSSDYVLLSRLKKPFRQLLWFLSAYLAVCSLVALFLVNVTLHPTRRPLPTGAEEQTRAIAVRFQAHLQDVGIIATDGAALGAWHIQRERSNGGAIILLHGLGDNRLGTVGYAELFLAHGYDVLMPDARTHGVSSGRIATYGVLERNDIRSWFEWLEAREHPQCIYGFAESMGAAQLLQSLDVEPHFCAVVAESTFSNFREIAYDRMGQYFHTGPWLGRTVLRPIIEIALLYTRCKYHVNLADASPQDSVAHSQVPVLLIHGQIDSNIPVRHSWLIKLHDPAVTLWEVPGADHCGAVSVSPQEFEKRVVGWFDEHRRPTIDLRSAEQSAK